jgi:phenylalanyl-tRNA synthetase beta chain
VAGAEFEPVQDGAFQTGRCARLRVGEVVLGVLGELHPVLREGFGLPERRVAAAELDLEAVLGLVPVTWFVRPVSAYPAVLQDLAVVVDEAVPAAQVQRLVVDAAGPLLQDVRLFDVYRGQPVPAGRKSLAFALSFQAPDRTLSDEQVAKQVKRIVGRLGKELGAELRS